MSKTIQVLMYIEPLLIKKPLIVEQTTQILNNLIEKNNIFIRETSCPLVNLKLIETAQEYSKNKKPAYLQGFFGDKLTYTDKNKTTVASTFNIRNILKKTDSGIILNSEKIDNLNNTPVTNLALARKPHV